ncbi:MAG: CoA transferase [Rhodospirillaceae bacterium]|nr:CoA transferase [Rhodospirillaceae bacterium]
MADLNGTTNDAGGAAGPLAGLRVLDLSRILAGPTCTQLLGDLGADVIKVERPGAGDDTRKWGPPYVRDAEGRETTESAYYLCCNRNKRSVTIDFTRPEGAALVRRLAAGADVLIENFKVGGLAKYGLAYADLRDEFPRLVYCSISGFGQGGPYANRPGYDFMIQGMGGIMSMTGEPEGEPMKVAVGIADVMCGMYASTAILAALRHRDATGEGQYIDLALLDSQIAWLINGGLYYLTSGEPPPRFGNAHPNIVPYQVVPSSDGYFILAVGNDRQFRSFCESGGRPELADDPLFLRNADRVRNRAALVPLVEEMTRRHTTAFWIEELERRNVPCGPVNDLRQVFDDPQVKHRNMRITLPHPLAGSGEVALIGSPVKMSATPVSYRQAPPVLGEHTDAVLEELLGLDATERGRLRSQQVI